MNANEFTFNLYQTDENYSIQGLEPIQTTTNVAGVNGAETGFSFTNIPFETAGTYYFVVTETKGDLGGITYDSSKYEIKVEVEDNLDGTMTAKVVAVNGSATNKVSFTNTYKADKETSAAFEVEKVLNDL